LFFVLSGYVISRPFVGGLVRGELPGIGVYARRRAFRILPLFWLSLFVVAVTTTGWTRATPTAKLSNLFLVMNLVPGQQNGTIISVWWTLSLEACFYVLVPVVAWLLMRWRPGGISASRLAAGVLAIWALSALWSLTASTLHQTETGLWLRQVFPAMLASFCPGILLAVSEQGDLLAPRFRNRIESLVRKPHVVFPVVVILVAMGAYSATAVTHIPLVAFSPQFYAVGYGLVVAWALRVHVPDHKWIRVWAWFGLISYGIYVWHAVVLRVITDHRAGLPFTTGWRFVNGIWLPAAAHSRLLDDVFRFGWILLLTTAAAALSWYLLESRLIGWAHRGQKAPASVRLRGADS
jgi:peptidoglycan/LPS O-acetylase OafA/YrhL